jgi:hypothetical protein
MRDAIAVCSWQGTKFRGRFVRPGTSGYLVIEALDKGPRWTVGSHLGVTTKEIVRWEGDPPLELVKT